MAGLEEKKLPSDIYYYLEACGEPHVRKVLALRNAYKGSKPPLEALCAATEVDPNIILTAVMQTIDRLTNYSAAVRMSSSKESIVDALVTAATDPEGTEDRALFMKATGLLPQPKGAQTIINMTQNSAAPTVAVFAPAPDKTIKRLSERFNALQLPPPAEDYVQPEEDESEA